MVDMEDGSNHQTNRLFELCDPDNKGYLTKSDLKVACPQLSPGEIDFIFSCLDTDSSGVIEKAEFCAGFEETLCKGQSQGFDNIQNHAVGGSGGGADKYHPDDNVQVFEDGLIEEEEEGEEHSTTITTTTNGTANGLLMPTASGAPNNRYHYARVGPKTQLNRVKRNKDAQLGFQKENSEGNLFSPQRRSQQPHHSRRMFIPDRKLSQPQLTMDAIPCKDEVLELYEELQSSGVPQIMSKFEEVVGTLCREIDQREKENQHLQNQQKAERDNYHKRMSEIEQEIDQQLLIADRKAREEERQRLNREKQELKERLEKEMLELQSNIEHLQKMEKVLKKESTNKNGNQESLKEKLDDIARENRVLKNNLADNHLEMTIIKAELAELKCEYENKQMEMMTEKEEILASASESENIQRQLQLLYDANQRLHNTNDTLRGALDQRTNIIKQLNIVRQSSLIGGSPSTSNNLMLMPQHSHASLLDGAHPHHHSHGVGGDEDDRVPSADSGFPMRTSSSRTSVSDLDLFRCASIDTTRDDRSGTAINSSYKSSLVEFSGPPDRTFRVVMCGDSAVGKSSIITRIVKGSFQTNIASTLGVDFHVKSIKMDKTNVAVQLWDTAGQERFRSLCNSYFRRADGAILVYDCSFERTFLRIRDWIETVQESVCRNIPILLVGNKTDLRRRYEENPDGYTGGPSSQATNTSQSMFPLGMGAGKDGESLAQIFNEKPPPPIPPRFVTQKEGENLAKDLETEFIECSALDGSNIEAALLLLVGEMMKLEDKQMKETAVTLAAGAKKPKKSSCFSCRN